MGMNDLCLAFLVVWFVFNLQDLLLDDCFIKKRQQFYIR